MIKNNFSILLLVAILIFPIYIKAQDVGFDHAKSFFRADKFRIGTSISFDTSISNEKGKAYFISSSGNINKDNLTYSKNPNFSIGLGVDIFSPLSTLGFYIEPTLNIQNFVIKGNNSSLRDSLSINSFEIPIYAKLRFGGVKSKNHTWLAIGGGYSLINKASSKTMSNKTILAEFDSKKQFKSTPFLSAILGYEYIITSSKPNGKEVYDRDDFRALFFVKANYDLNNRLDNTGIYSNTALDNYQNPNLKFLKVSVGVKVLLRISMLGKLATGTILKNI